MKNIQHELQLPSVLMHYTEYSPSYPFYVTQQSKEYICKKCDKDLLEEVMPMNSVTSQI